MSACAEVAPGRKEEPVCVHQPSLPPLRTVSQFPTSVCHLHSIKLPEQHLRGAKHCTGVGAGFREKMEPLLWGSAD